MIEKQPAPLVQPDMIFSVSDASALLKGVVETAFSQIRIRGELSQITRASSGHVYMTVKDAGAAINAIIWRGTPLPFQLADGLEMAGVGAILKMLEERKQKLAAEGLFDASRKKALPRFPSVIGIVTSPTGAAFQDICNRLSERFPVQVLLYPAIVQGTTAAAEVAAGVKYFNDKKNVDVIIVARGGGSLEDLLPFSEEIVVRAVAESKIPIVSGVGHEPDWMLIDFAADVRAPTPTGAAEIVVPTKVSLIQEIETIWHRLHSSFSSKLLNARARMDSIVIKSPRQLIMEQQQRLDDTARTLEMLYKNKISRMHQSISHFEQMLNSLSYKNVLNRGFAMVRNGDKIIGRASDFKRPDQIEFSDGVVEI